MRGGRRGLAVLALALAAFAAVAGVARAELTASGDLFVRFSGGISPEALPRTGRAPIAVRVGGTVRTLSGHKPPALRRITIALNRGGRIDGRGLPLCRQGQITPGSTAEALAACGGALVGEGSYTAVVAFPEQPRYLSRGRIVAFNAVVGGQRAILAHAYAPKPVPSTRILVFHIHRRSGTFGTVLSAALPPALNRWGYLHQISLDLHREFVRHGRERSYVSASCAAPAGARGGVFPFARAAMSFEDGRRLASTLTRTCRVAAPPR